MYQSIGTKQMLELSNFATLELQNKRRMYQFRESRLFRQESPCICFINRLNPVTICQSHNELHHSGNLDPLLSGPHRGTKYRIFGVFCFSFFFLKVSQSNPVNCFYSFHCIDIKITELNIIPLSFIKECSNDWGCWEIGQCCYDHKCGPCSE